MSLSVSSTPTPISIVLVWPSKTSYIGSVGVGTVRSTLVRISRTSLTFLSTFSESITLTGFDNRLGYTPSLVVFYIPLTGTVVTDGGVRSFFTVVHQSAFSGTS